MKASWFKFSFLDGVLLTLFIFGMIGFVVLPFGNKNNRGVLYMLRKNHEKANEVFIKCLNNKPPFCRMNRALNHFFLKKNTESIKEYDIVKKYTKNKLFLFYTSFNSAISATVNQDEKSALKFYQSALFYQPNSIEVKTNIELLFSDEQNQQKSQEQQDKKNQKKQNQSKDDKAQKDKKDTDEKKQQENKEQHKDKENLNESNAEEKRKMKEQEQAVEQEKQGAQQFNKKQIQAILKSILEQEKEIRKKQQQKQTRSPILEKDW